MNNVLIEVIITNQCNKRCEYCDLNFNNTFISDYNIDLLLKYLNNSTESFHLNFFGGEPLLGIKKIKKIINGINRKNINYSIGTNGNLLNTEILDFLNSNNVKINLSVDNITGFNNILKINKKYVNLININFINDPEFLHNSIIIFNQIIKKGFININFMPVFSTKKRLRNNFIILGCILKYIKLYKKLNINYFSYFNGISSDKQFILDTNGFFYNDLDSLLWIQKQYTNLDISLKNKIDNKSFNIKLEEKDFSFEKLLNNHNIEDIVNLVMEIPKNQKYTKDYIILDHILKNGNK